MNFGEYIKNRRLSLKLTQVELGNFLHITPQCLSNYEKDKNKIPLSLVLDLCFYLKVSINDFINKDEVTSDIEFDLTTHNFNNVHKNIAYNRENSKLTLKELSKKLNISIQRLSDFELDKASPSIDEFILIADFYHQDYESFFRTDSQIVTTKNSTITKKQINKKVLYGAISVSALVIGVIAITTSVLLLNDNKENATPITPPSLSNFVLKENIEDETGVTNLIKNKDYYLFAYFNNAKNYNITSFKINDINYLKDSFNKDSTNEKIIVKFNTSSLDFGHQKINFNGFSYLNDLNNENYIEVLNSSIDIAILNNEIPTVTTSNHKVTSSSISGSLSVLNDSYSFLKNKEITLKLSCKDTLVKELKTSSTYSFDNLEPETTYHLEGSIDIDFKNGQGMKNHILFKKDFATKQLFKNIRIQENITSISYDLALENPNAFTINSIDLIDTIDNSTVYSGTALTSEITNLKSDHNYKFVVVIKRIEDNKEYSSITQIKTLKVQAPVINLNDLIIAEERITISPTISYALDNFNFTSIKLTSLKDSKIIEYKEKIATYTFDNLLSNNDYLLEYSYTYDLLDGEGVRANKISINIKTLKYVDPVITFKSVSPNDNSVYFLIEETFDKVKATYLKTELYKSDILLETSTAKEGKFINLENNHRYVLKLYYSYDLKDGNGIITKTFEHSFITSSDIFIEDLRPGK